MDLTEPVIPRSGLSVGIEPSLRPRLAHLSAGRSVVIDYFASRRCSVVIGDITAEFRSRRPGRGYRQLASVESVQLFVEERLLSILEDAEVTLRLAGPPFARHLAVSLDPASRWIEFLEQPPALAGKRQYRPAR